MTRYPSQDGTQIDAYTARPAAPGRYPGVIVVMEAYGLMEHYRDVARRFAAEGYIALAPDLYTREGPVGPEESGQFLKALFSAPDSQVMADLEGAAVYLKGLPDCTGRVGAIGFCSGGRYTLIFACKTTNLDAAVDSAGGFIDLNPVLQPDGGFVSQDGPTPERPALAVDMVPDLSCPLLATFGEEDSYPTPAAAARLEESLDRAGKTYEFRMYPNAGHAFFNDTRPSYRPVAAQDMWHRVLVFFEKYLKS